MHTPSLQYPSACWLSSCASLLPCEVCLQARTVLAKPPCGHKPPNKQRQERACDLGCSDIADNQTHIAQHSMLSSRMTWRLRHPWQPQDTPQQLSGHPAQAQGLRWERAGPPYLSKVIPRTRRQLRSLHRLNFGLTRALWGLPPGSLPHVGVLMLRVCILAGGGWILGA